MARLSLNKIKHNCNGCAKRKVGCHSVCEEYNAIKKKQIKLNDKEHRQRINCFESNNKVQKRREV